MRNEATIAVVIPALNEQEAIGHVLDDIPEWVDRVLVVDNGSTDATAEVARNHGATVLHEPRRGYGTACLAGISALDDTDLVVFLDADYSDDPKEMDAVVQPILEGDADLVIGSRTLGKRESGALTLQARFGNRLSCILIRILWHVRYTDLGPFRAIRFHQLQRLAMRDRDFGWTVEMQVKAAKAGLRVTEIPVTYRKRIGKSKISGTIGGVLAAGSKILYTIAREAILKKKPTQTTRDRLLVFTRFPVPGETKTRLIPALGPDGAAACQRAMTERIVGTARKWRAVADAEVMVCFTGAPQGAMVDWLGEDLLYQIQAEGDLGRRMYNALRRSRLAGMDRTVLIGSDCPGINAEILAEAFHALNDHDLVVGPTVDGGYYLIAACHPQRALFEGIAWGTANVLKETRHAAAIAGLQVAQLRVLRDVDSSEDLEVWRDISGNC